MQYLLVTSSTRSKRTEERFTYWCNSNFHFKDL